MDSMKMHRTLTLPEEGSVNPQEIMRLLAQIPNDIAYHTTQKIAAEEDVMMGAVVLRRMRDNLLCEYLTTSKTKAQAELMVRINEDVIEVEDQQLKRELRLKRINQILTALETLFVGARKIASIMQVEMQNLPR